MKFRLLLISLFSTALQFGLAVLGSGGLAAFFAHPAFVGLAVATLVLVAVGIFSAGNLNPGEQEDRGNRWVLAAFGVLALLIAFLPAYTDRKGILVIDGDRTRWIGLVIFFAGSAFRLWPVFVLGKRFSGLVAIQPGHTLVTTGVYSQIRNPSYLGLLAGTMGWALVFRAGVGVLLAALMLVPLVARMNAEERLLREHFGSEYDAYYARTKRLIPGVY
jgi:protein-S-isoprenylcysteine O-methyltransferase Ste14